MVERILTEMPKTNLPVEHEALLYVKLSETQADIALANLVLEQGFSVKFVNREHVQTATGHSTFGFWFEGGMPSAVGISRNFIEQIKEGDMQAVENLGMHLKNLEVNRRL